MSSHPSGNLFGALLILIGRLGIGAVFLVHGLQKLLVNGIPATAAGFTQLGIPLPEAAAWFATLVEVAGGVALVLGAFTRLAAILLAGDMLGALVLVHLPKGFWVTEGGYEFVLALAAAAVILAGAGAGRLSIDGLVRGRYARRKSARLSANPSATDISS